MGNVAPYAGAVQVLVLYTQMLSCVSDVCCCCIQTAGTSAVYAYAVVAVVLGAVAVCALVESSAAWDAAYVVDVCVVAVDSSC